ncbi:MAG: Z1 domain-containing protein [Ureaplasma sp.]|nr:Z1 domain-containing protein [Ureaplasma sp.]
MLLKEKNNLENTYEYLCNNIHILNKKKILIIDDESDYASINTSRDKNQTKIYDLINKIYGELNNVGMLLVTATPFANIMTTKTTNQVSSIYTLKSPDEYTGISFFNNLDNFYLCNHSMLDINLNELDKLILFSFFVWIYQSYCYFKENSNEKSTLLIYCSDEKNEHEKCKNIIYEQIVNFKGMYRSSFEKFIKNKYKINDQNEINKITKWIINQKLEKQIFILNSDQKDELNLIENINNQKLSIVIGGVMLSRGITYENLLTELFLYCSNNDVNCDVLLQRCRWFGYRIKNNRYKYMNLITKENIVNNLKEAEKFNNILFENNGYKIDVSEVYKKIEQLEKNSNLGATNNVKK